MKTLLCVSAALAAFSLPVYASGDVDKGEREYNKCKACHVIESESETIVRGGGVGPNLYGVIGRVMGGVEGYNYSDGLKDRAATGEVWTEESLAEYVKDPAGYIGSRSKMTFKLRSGGEDVAAYLATFSD